MRVGLSLTAIPANHPLLTISFVLGPLLYLSNIVSKLMLLRSSQFDEARHRTIIGTLK